MANYDSLVATVTAARGIVNKMREQQNNVDAMVIDNLLKRIQEFVHQSDKGVWVPVEEFVRMHRELNEAKVPPMNEEDLV